MKVEIPEISAISFIKYIGKNDDKEHLQEICFVIKIDECETRNIHFEGLTFIKSNKTAENKYKYDFTLEFTEHEPTGIEKPKFKSFLNMIQNYLRENR